MNVRPIQNESDLRRVTEAAAADDHATIAPSHFLEVRGNVRGYFSVNSIWGYFWSHTGNPKSVSLKFAKAGIKAATAEAQARGGKFILPCVSGSPFKPLLPGLGFKQIIAGMVNDVWIYSP